MKLTKPQRRALLTMLEYDCFAYSAGHSAHAFFGQPCPSTQKVRWSTIRSLRDRGLLQNLTPDNMRWRGSKYALTPLGKEIAEGLRYGT